MRKFPPKGYNQQIFPLPHSHSFSFALDGESATGDSTIVPLFHMSEAAAGAENIEVNPTNSNFAEDTGSVCHRNSIVPKLSLSIDAHITKVGRVTDALKSLVFNWFPIYIAFLDDLDAADEKTGFDIETILELQHDVTNKDTFPLYVAGTDLSESSSIGLSTVPFTEVLADKGLDTEATFESVAFDENQLFDALQFFTNAGKLKKVMGKRHSILVKEEHPYRYFSNNFTYPTVKRMNPFTFCGILFHLPQGGVSQMFQPSEVTNIAHLQISGRIRFDEWNNAFEQAVI